MEIVFQVRLQAKIAFDGTNRHQSNRFEILYGVTRQALKNNRLRNLNNAVNNLAMQFVSQPKRTFQQEDPTMRKYYETSTRQKLIVNRLRSSILVTTQ